jgi:rare lipoprotein A
VAKVRVEILPNDSQREQMIARGEGGRPVLASAAGARQSAADVPPTAPQAVPQPPVQVAALEAPTGAASAPARADQRPRPTGSGGVAAINATPSPGTVENVPVESSEIWVQAGAFENRDNAKRLSDQLRGIGTSSVKEAQVAGRTFYRVRIGPMTEVAAADHVLEQLIGAGFPGSRIVVD